MLFQQKYMVAENQKGLLYKDKKFIKVLDAGKYRFWSVDKDYELTLVGTIAANREITSEEVLSVIESHPAEFSRHVDLWETGAEEIGLVYEQNVLRDIKLPGQHGAYWKGVRKTRIDKINIGNDFSISQRMAALMLGAESAPLRQSASKTIFAATVPEDHVGFLEIDGKVTRTLSTGTYAWWKFSRVLNVKLFDMRLQNMEVNGQEILTKDKVSLRINLSAIWQIANADLVRQSLTDHTDYLYREMQLALRTVVSTQTLDQLLADKNLLNSQIKALVSAKAQEYGISVKTVGARDIVLPGEMKSILAQVVEAEKLAEANLIKRREETQATRSLHNTAKVMENNPILLRLKELESLERITGQISTLNVYGGLDGVMNDMIKLTSRTNNP
ncbi:MAG: slipin family protein [Burkholderiales bacterium]|nr:slipin family protein [Burkholderiales bacterium]MDR4518823.1 slipin family protein [Nitrosomonas sp.]